MNRTGFGNEQKQKAKPARSKTNEKKYDWFGLLVCKWSHRTLVVQLCDYDTNEYLVYCKAELR